MRSVFNFVAGAALIIGLDSCADGRVEAIPAIGNEFVNIGKNGMDIGIIVFNEGVEAFNATINWGQRQLNSAP